MNLLKNQKEVRMRLKIEPIKMRRWQYIQLIGTVATTFLSVMCVGILIGSLLYGVYLIHNKNLQWYAFIVSYLLLLIASIGIDRLFYRLYLIQRRNRIYKRRGSDETDEQSSVWRDVISLLAIVGIITIILVFINRGESTEQSGGWFKNKAFWIALGVVGIGGLIYYFGSKRKLGGLKVKDINLSWKWITGILGGAVGIIGIVLVIIYWKDIFGSKETHYTPVQIVQNTTPTAVHLINPIKYSDKRYEAALNSFTAYEIHQGINRNDRSYAYGLENIGDSATIFIVNETGTFHLTMHILRTCQDTRDISVDEEDPGVAQPGDILTMYTSKDVGVNIVRTADPPNIAQR